MADTVSTKGYAATTVADVIERAGVSRKTFYEHFGNKEDCFIAAFDHGTELLSAAILSATGDTDDADDRLLIGYQTLCATLAQMPSFARAFAVVAAEAGTKASTRRAHWREASIARLRALYSGTAKEGLTLPDELPEHTARAIVGAIDSLITHHIETAGPESLHRLVPTIVSIAHTLMHQNIAAPITED
ncbi:transcriptional regulator [Mycobacteroides abscessus subsp. bolletii]|nr:transcriptional regulator [Mycobacteroides abscessus subsp. bolletii]SLF40600.1 transcriptional regulator [Mycobacteroides abscessus subsp. bolletii]